MSISRWKIRTCPSDFTDFTVSLRIYGFAVNSGSLVNQRVEGGIYGVLRILRCFYTHTIIEAYKNTNMMHACPRAYEGVCKTVKSVKSVKRVLQRLINQRVAGFTDFKTHRKKIGHTVKNFTETGVNR